MEEILENAPITQVYEAMCKKVKGNIIASKGVHELKCMIEGRIKGMEETRKEVTKQCTKRKEKNVIKKGFKQTKATI